MYKMIHCDSDLSIMPLLSHLVYFCRLLNPPYSLLIGGMGVGVDRVVGLDYLVSKLIWYSR